LNWSKLIQILASWIISPVFSAFVAFLVMIVVVRASMDF